MGSVSYKEMRYILLARWEDRARLSGNLSAEAGG